MGERGSGSGREKQKQGEEKEDKKTETQKTYHSAHHNHVLPPNKITCPQRYITVLVPYYYPLVNGLSEKKVCCYEGREFQYFCNIFMRTLRNQKIRMKRDKEKHVFLHSPN